MCYNDRYGGVNALLLYFVIYGKDGHAQIERLDDVGVIKKFVYDNTHEQVGRSIDQGREMLSLERLPEEWIGNIMSHACPTTRIITWRKWIQWVVDTLESEARKAGKL